MGNRKDNSKKICRAPVFTWSSDEDEDILPLPRESLQNSRRHPRTSVDDMPGTSGINGGQASSEDASASSRRKYLCSNINDTATDNQDPRRIEGEFILVKNVTIRPTDEASIKARRLIEFKNLTRSLQNLKQTLSTCNNAQPTTSCSVPRVATGIAPPYARHAPPMNQANSRHDNTSFRPAPNFTRTAVPPGYAVPVYSTNMPPSSHSGHLYSRPVASTGYPTPYFHPRATAVPMNGTYTQPRSASAGRAPPPNSRDTANHSTSYPAWAGGNRTGHTEAFLAWATDSTTHGGSFPMWSPESNCQTDPAAMWNAAMIQGCSVWDEASRDTMRMSSTQQNVADNFDGRRWRRSLPAFPIRGFWDAVFNNPMIFPTDPEDLPPTWRYNFERAREHQENGSQNPSPSNNNDDNTETTPEMPISMLETEGPMDNSRSMVPIEEPGDEENVDNPGEEEEEEEIAEDLSRRNTNTAALIEEEVVEEVDPNDIENLHVPLNDTDEVSDEPTSENTTNVAAVAAELHAQGNSQPKQDSSSFEGLKRKRDAIDDRREPFSVHDFNQNLLRLLECPVCLEWMEPPISQCRRGHLVCCRCRTRLNTCPVCRTPFSSVRNRAMEGVADMLRYPCRHGCGLEVRLRRRSPHEASCAARRYQCPAPDCTRYPPLPRDELAHHFQCKHLPILKIGRKHRFSIKVNAEQHDSWLIMALDEYFHLRVDVDIRTWGVVLYVSYIGPKKDADSFYYEVSVHGHLNSRKLVYTRTTHSDLENSSVNVSRQDCFHLTLDQALNFLRVKNKYCQPDKFLDFDVELSKSGIVDETTEDSD